MEQTGGGLAKICDFLQSFGGVYATIPRKGVEDLAYSLASGQYVIGYEDEKILYFSAFWRIEYDDVEMIRRVERPKNILHGPAVYVVEAGSRMGLGVVVEKLKDKNPDAEVVLYHRRGVLKQHSLLQRGWS